MVGTQEQGGRSNTKKGNRNSAATDGKDDQGAAGPGGPAGKGKGKHDQTPTPPTEQRLAFLKEKEEGIKKLGCCLSFNRGTCKNGDNCKHKHKYFSEKIANEGAGKAAPAAPKSSPGKKKYTLKELAERAKQPCPCLSKPSGCSFGDKCHFNHDATHGGVALAYAGVALACVAQPVDPPPPAPVLGMAPRQDRSEIHKRETAALKLMACPFAAKRSGCSFGDKCHFNHGDVPPTCTIDGPIVSACVARSVDSQRRAYWKSMCRPHCSYTWHITGR